MGLDRCNTTDDDLYIVVEATSETDLIIAQITTFVTFFLSRSVEPTRNYVTVIQPVQGTSLRFSNLTSAQEILFFQEQLLTLVSLNYSSVPRPPYVAPGLFFITKLLYWDNHALDGNLQAIIACFIVCHVNCASRIYPSQFFLDHVYVRRFFFIFTPLNDFKDFKRLLFLYNNENATNILLDNNVVLSESYLSEETRCILCPPGWIEYRKFGNSSISLCYTIHISPVQLSWNEAAKHCSMSFSNLPVIETHEELHFLAKTLTNARKVNKRTEPVETVVVHVGLTKANTGHDRLQWTNGRPFVLAGDIKVKNIKSKCLVFSLPIHKEDSNRNKIRGSDWELVDCTKNITEIVVCEKDIDRTNYSTEIRYSSTTQMVEQKMPSLNKEFISVYGAIHSIASPHYYRDSAFTTQYKPLLFDCQYDLLNIPYSNVCDNVPNCRNSRDEIYCGPNVKLLMSRDFFCENPNSNKGFPTVTKIRREKKCDFIQDCPDRSDETECDECMGRRCSDGTCLPRHWLSRDWEDCSLLDNSNGFMFINITVESLYFENRQHEVIYCAPSKDVWAPKCIYLRGRGGQIMGCNDMFHLKDCLNFVCPDNFVKCWNSYCVPRYLVNDGVMDCQHGEDEVEPSHTVSGYFRCKSYNFILIHPVEVCDGLAQCPDADDELNCNFTCPGGFHCYGSAATVDKHSDVVAVISLSIFDINTKFLNISGIDLSLLNKLYILPNLLILHASRCNLKSLQFLFSGIFPSAVFYLDLSYNKFTQIDFTDSSLVDFYNLLFLTLSGNENLSSLNERWLDPDRMHSDRLKKIDLSFTNISSIQFNFKNYLLPDWLDYINISNTDITNYETLSDIISLGVLDMRNTPLRDESIVYVLKKIRIRTALYVDNYKYCCPQIVGPGIPKHVCNAPFDGISSCEDLIGDVLKRSLVWLVAVISLAGNVLVLAFRMIYDRTSFKKGYGIFVTNLGISDFIMGMYITLIFSVDIFYKDIYVIYETVWRNSALCKFAGFLSTLSSETSTLFVCLITLDRFLVIRFPFGEYRLTKSIIVIFVVTSWVIGFILALIPVVYPHWMIYSSNGMCLGLPLTTNRPLGLPYAIGVFIVFNFILFLAISLGQVLIFVSISRQRVVMDTANAARREQDINVAKQLFIIVLSNFLCWFPICVTGLMSVNDHVVSPDVYGWFLVFVLPLNAAINPLIYTIPTIYAKWLDFKKGGRSTTVSSQDR